MDLLISLASFPPSISSFIHLLIHSFTLQICQARNYVPRAPQRNSQSSCSLRCSQASGGDRRQTAPFIVHGQVVVSATEQNKFEQGDKESWEWDWLFQFGWSGNVSMGLGEGPSSLFVCFLPITSFSILTSCFYELKKISQHKVNSPSLGWSPLLSHFLHLPIFCTVPFLCK